MDVLFGSETFPEFQPVAVAMQRKALVIDDDVTQSEVLSYRLAQLGFSVEARTRGKGTLELAKQLQPDVILLDIELPDSDGLEICAQLNDDCTTLDIPVVILSGTDRIDVVRAARSAGSRFFIQKPYDPNTLQLVIENVLRN